MQSKQRGGELNQIRHLKVVTIQIVINGKITNHHQ